MNRPSVSMGSSWDDKLNDRVTATMLSTGAAMPMIEAPMQRARWNRDHLRAAYSESAVESATPHSGHFLPSSDPRRS